MHLDYRPIVEENKELIALSMEKNPRELKTFLNNLIISYEVFSHVPPTKDESEKKNFLKQLLLVQIIKSNWKVIYAHIMDSSLLKDGMRMIPNYVEEFEKILTRLRIVKAGNKDRINILIDKLTRLKIHAELSGIYDKY